MDVSLADDIQGSVRRAGSRGFELDRIMAKLSKADREALLQFLCDPSVPPDQISRGLGRNGFKVGRGAIANYRLALQELG